MNLQNNNNLLNEHLNELKDYKLLEIKNVNQKIGGFKSVQKKVIPKIDQEIIKHSFSNIAAFEMFFKK